MVFGMVSQGKLERVLRRAAVIGAGILAVRFAVAFLAGVAIEVWRVFG
jgi:hypothetical protein